MKIRDSWGVILKIIQKDAKILLPLFTSLLIVSCQSLPQLNVQEGLGRLTVLSQHEGEVNLHTLARVSPKEDQWLFLPSSRIWVNVGEGEEGDAVAGDLKKILAIVHERGEGTALFYHIHPLHGRPKDFPAPPSAEDLHVHAVMKRAFRDRYGISLISRVFDGYGVWEYDVDKSLEERFRLQDYSNEEVREIAYPELRPYYQSWQLREDAFFSFAQEYLERTRPIVSDPIVDRSERISAMELISEPLGVFLRYEPFP